MNCGILYLVLFSLWASAANRQTTYEPSVVTLEGLLDLQTFPGPPNFEDISSGDKIERHFYLKLNAPIDVIPKGPHPGVDNPETEYSIRVLQLAIDGEDRPLWSQFRTAERGRNIKVRGTLFHRFTGHHHSRVLLRAPGLSMQVRRVYRSKPVSASSWRVAIIQAAARRSRACQMT